MATDITSLAISVKSDGIKEASSSLGGLSVSAGNAEKRVTSFTAAMEKLNLIQRTSTTAADAYMLKLREQAALMQSLNVNSRGATGSTQTLAAAMALLSNSLNTLNANTQRADRSQRGHNDAMRDAHGLARGLSGSLGALWMTYGAVTSMAVGVAIGASLKGVISVGKDVEHTLEGIRVRGNETVESVGKLRDVVYDLGKGVYGPQQVATALETLVLAGLNAAQAAQSIGAALNLATVGGTTIERAATTLVSVGTAIGYTAEGFSRVADVIAKTAALSMSSVETLSEAFKSASSVNRLYGVSLEDIATSLGVLSNLGIRGSAAGTALKNFYKELASGAEDVTKTLKDMGLTQESFKDSAGNFKPLLDVVEILDGGMQRLTLNSQKLGQANLSNERGQRLMTQLLGEYNTKVGSSSNALTEFRKRVEDSYGFAAIGAVQMALTTKSQLESMFNTLKTTFAEVFKEIEPEVTLFSIQMKAAFGSKDFKEGVTTLASAFANLALAIAENIPLLTKLVVAMLAIKAAMIAEAVWASAAAGVTALGAAFAGMTAGTLTLTAALPALAIVLGVVAAAWVAYKLVKDDAQAEKSVAVAAAYANSYLDGMIKEAEKLQLVTQKMRENKSALDANAEVERSYALQKMQDTDNEAVRITKVESLAAREKLAKQGLSQNRIDSLTSTSAKTGLAAVDAYVESLGRQGRAEQRAANNTVLATAAMDSLNRVGREHAEVVKAQADAARKKTEAEGAVGLSGKPNVAAANDSYKQALREIQGRIEHVKRELQYAEEDLQSRYKQGLIGEISLIKEKEFAEKNAAATTIRLLQEKLEKSHGKENKAAVSQEIINALAAQRDTEVDSARKSVNAQAVYYAQLEESIAKSEADGFYKRGEFVNAYIALNESKHNISNKHLIDNIANETDAARRAMLVKQQFANQAAFDAGIQTAAVKEAVNEFDKLHASISNTLKGVQTGSEGQGMAAMFSAAMEASEKYRASLPALQEALNKVSDAAFGGSDVDQTKYDEALSKQKSLAEHQRKMWAGVGESISKSLGGAFGKAGKAMADMAKVSIAYNNEENKSAGTKVKLYGDMAGAAAGFFDEQSSGYRTLTAISQVFHAAELAMSVAELVPKALGAVLNQGNGDPYTAFGRMAAMATIVAGLGIAIGGAVGGGSSSGISSAQEAQKQRIASQGTGTVLGDSEAKSESIVNSLSLLTKYAFEDLEYSNKMLTAMQSIASALTGVSKSLVLTQGLMAGTNFGTSEGTKESSLGSLLGSVFGGKKTTTITGSGIDLSGTVGQLASGNGIANQYEEITKTKSGGWFSKGSTKKSRPTEALADDVVDSFAKTFASVRDGLVEVGSTLGMGAEQLANQINAIPVNLTAELRGLKGKELEAEITAVFSAHIDLITNQALAVVEPYQLMGEGLFETAVRVANSFRVIDLELQSIGMTFGSVGTSSMAARMGLVEMMGGLEEFTSKTDFFKDNFLSETERMTPVIKAVSLEMARLGQSSITSIESFKTLVLQQDLSTIAGQAMYVALMNLAPAFDKSVKYTEELAAGTVKMTDAQQKLADIANKQHELDITLMEAQGNATGVLAAHRADELKALTLLSPALAKTQQAIYDVTDAATEQAVKAKAAKTIADANAGYQKQIDDLIKPTLTLAQQREMEIAGMDKSTVALYDRLAALKAEIALTKTVTEGMQGLIRSGNAAAALSSAMSLVTTKFSDFTDAAGNFVAANFNAQFARDKAVQSVKLAERANSDALNVQNIGQFLGSLSGEMFNYELVRPIYIGIRDAIVEASGTVGTYVVRDAVDALSKTLAETQVKNQYSASGVGLLDISNAQSALSELSKTQTINGVLYAGDTAIEYAKAVDRISNEYKRGKISVDELNGTLSSMTSSLGNLSDHAQTEESLAQARADAANRAVSAGLASIQYYFNQLSKSTEELSTSAETLAAPINKVTEAIGRLNSISTVFSTSSSAAMTLGGAGLDANQVGSINKSTIIADAAKIASQIMTTQDADVAAKALKDKASFADTSATGLRNSAMLLDGLKAFDPKSFENTFLRINDALIKGTVTATQYEDLFTQSLNTFKGVDKAVNAVEASFATLRTAAKSLADQLLIDKNLSTLSPVDRFAEAQRQYAENTVLARTGDAVAISKMDSVTNALLTIGQETLNNSLDYSNLFAQTITDLRGLEATYPTDKQKGQDTTSNAEVVAAIEKLREDIRASSGAVASNTSTTVAKLNEILINGIPAYVG